YTRSRNRRPTAAGSRGTREDAEDVRTAHRCRSHSAAAPGRAGSAGDHVLAAAHRGGRGDVDPRTTSRVEAPPLRLNPIRALRKRVEKEAAVETDRRKGT